MRNMMRMVSVYCLIVVFSIVYTPVRAADATVATCDFASFQAAIATANTGGGTIDFTCSGTINVTVDVVISANVIINGGGAIILDGGGASRIFVVSGGANLTLNNITLQNAFTTGDGSAIYALGNVTINNSIIQDNRSNDDAGAIYVSAPDVVTATNTIFRRNSTNGLGGAIGAEGFVVVTGSSFDSNAGGFGGAIFVSSSGGVTVNTSTFSNNTATDGGGAIRSAGSSSITNSTFYNNSAGNTGGAIRNQDTVSINHSTFSNNSSPTGGALENLGAGNLTITNSIISGTGNQCNNAGVTFTVDASNITDNACGASTATANLFLGTFNGVVVPLTSPSPAVDFYAPACSLATDQIGLARPQGARCDAGAVEFTPTNLNATWVCIGDALEVNITSGDAPFQVTANSGTLATGLLLGTTLIPAFGSQTGVNVTELGGDTQNFPLGDIDCTPNNLSASAICVGEDLHVTIGNGEAPFQITATSGTLVANVPASGLVIIPAIGNVTNVNVTELAGDTQNVPLGDFNCVATVIPPSTPSTGATVLGCVFDAPTGVEIANAPDNTYCRLLMRNGGVVDYSGAVPAEFISLGVILAVDVYRLEGGMSINIFPDYARICLSGVGRYFYMDGRNAPRYSVEMPTETVDGLTCAWIPAPGTVILTN